MVILTNAEIGLAFSAITNEALDMMLGATGRRPAPRPTRARGAADEDWKEHVAERATNSTPSVPLAAYAGTSRAPWYGDVFIRVRDSRLEIQFSKTAELLGDLEHG